MDNTRQDIETDSAVQEDISSLEKLTQSYLLLKKRIYSAHEVIKQYNDKVKECERLKNELRVMTKQAKKATFDYNTTLAKVLKVELQNTEYQKNIETLTATVENHAVRLAADNKHIQQLTCKISDVEKQNAEKIMEYDLEKSSLQVRIKELEQELKSAKKPHEMQMKKMEKKLNAEAMKSKLKVPPKCTMDVAVNTDPKSTANIAVNTAPKFTAEIGLNTTPMPHFIKPKPKMSDRCVMTKEFYNVKDNPYPVFCAKCETEIVPPPLDGICKVMKNQCPLPVQRIRSPSPRQTSSPLPKMHDMPDNQCKAETLSDTCSQTHDQANRNSYSLANVLQPASPITPLQATYFNDFMPQQMSNLINQSKYYMPLAANTHLGQTNATLTSSLPVIETLEKRIATLESKLKKQSRKQKAIVKNNCWQHNHSTSHCAHEMSNHSQSNVTLELMEKMLDLCNRSQQKDASQTDLYKEHMLANLRKPELNNMTRKKKKKKKKKKRLQSATKGKWKVEKIPKIIDKPCVKTKSKKRKILKLFGSHGRKSPEPEHSSAPDEISLNSESESHSVKSSDYNSPERYPSEEREIIENPIKSTKSLSNEADSGLSSDCVESCRTQCEVDTKTSSTVVEDTVSIQVVIEKSLQNTDSTVSPVKTCDTSIMEPSPESDYDGDDRVSVSSVESPEEWPVERQDSRDSPSQSKELPHNDDTSDPIKTETLADRSTDEPSSEPMKYNGITDLSVSKEEIEERPLDIRLDSGSENRGLPSDRGNDDTSILDTVSDKSANEPLLEHVKYNESKESSEIESLQDTHLPMSPERPEHDVIEHLSISKKEIDETPRGTLDTEQHVDSGTGNSSCDQDNCETMIVENTKYDGIEESSGIKSPEYTESPMSPIEICDPGINVPSSETMEHDVVETLTESKEEIEENPEETLDTRLHSDIQDKTLPDGEDDCDTITSQTIVKRRGRPPKQKSDNQHELLKKLNMNLTFKRPKKDAVIYPRLTGNSTLTPEELHNNVNKRDADIKAQVYTPRNRTRIAHTPKQALQDDDNIIKPKAEIRVNLYETSKVNDMYEAPVSKRTRSCKTNTRKRKVSDHLPETNIVDTKTMKIEHESIDLSDNGEDVKHEMHINIVEAISGGFENVTQKDINIIPKVLNLDCKTEETTDTCISTASVFESALKAPKPFIKESLNNKIASHRNVNDSSLCKYGLQSSQVESNLHVNDCITEERGPLHVNQLRKNVNNENFESKHVTIDCAPVESNAKEKTTNQIQSSAAEDIRDDTGNSFQVETPISIAMEFSNEKKMLNKSKKKEKKEIVEHVRAIDEYVKKKLERLIHSEWTMAIHVSVVDALKNGLTARIIAKCIIEFLCIEKKCNTELDKTYTPPAPLMTKAQQKFTPLLVDLKETYPDIIELVQSGIEFELFRPRKISHMRYVLMSLTGMYIALARVEKDRERVRIFCFDAMYFLHLNAMTVLYTVLTAWPEVLPNCSSTNEVLPKCMAHYILTQQCTYPLPKLGALKNLVSVYYKYPTGTVTKDIMDDLIAKLQEKPYNGLESALILVAKRENTAWTHKNLIRGALLPLIITNKVPSQYKAFCLLGNLLRPFPKDDSTKTVGEIAEQLRDLINSGELNSEQEEGIISALLSLSRQNQMFNMISRTLIKWKPSQPLSARTKDQIKSFLRLRDAQYWKIFLKRQKHKRPRITDGSTTKL